MNLIDTSFHLVLFYVKCKSAYILLHIHSKGPEMIFCYWGLCDFLCLEPESIHSIILLSGRQHFRSGECAGRSKVRITYICESLFGNLFENFSSLIFCPLNLDSDPRKAWPAPGSGSAVWCSLIRNAVGMLERVLFFPAHFYNAFCCL